MLDGKRGFPDVNEERKKEESSALRDDLGDIYDRQIDGRYRKHIGTERLCHAMVCE